MKFPILKINIQQLFDSYQEPSLQTGFLAADIICNKLIIYMI